MVSKFLYVAKRESADGTEFHTVILFFAMASANFTGKVVVISGMMITVAPALNATKRSNTDMSKCSGQMLENLSFVVIWKKSRAVFTKVNEFR